MIRAVTFDAHGTLIRPEPSVGRIYADVAAAFGVDADPATLEAAFPAAFAAVRANWPVPYGADADDARRFWQAVVERTFARALPAGLAEALYAEFARPARWRALPGAREALACCAARGLPCAVVSNFDARLPALLAGLELGPFAAVIVSAEHGLAKPDARLLILAARRLGVATTQLLHIGDSQAEDGALARAAGCAWLPVDPARGIDPAALARALDGEG